MPQREHFIQLRGNHPATRPHIHRAWGESRTEPFFGPVGRDENPAAHGGVCEVETCRCGATRRTNVNQQHVERGQWVEP